MVATDKKEINNQFKEENEYSENKIHIVLNRIMFIWGIYMLLSGFYYLIHTTGMVSGSNFGTLITITHILSQLLILAGIKAIDMAIVTFDSKRPELLMFLEIKTIKNQLNKKNEND